jgi:hypothetical protein
MSENVLKLLERLTRASAKKEERLTDLLKNPEMDVSQGWYMHVPTCFNNALDLRQTPRKVDGKTETVWTQGSVFSFKPGDTIYDTPKAYSVWAEAVQTIRLCVQVKSAIDATSPQPSVPRSPGSVEFDVLVPNSDRTRLVHTGSHVLTQDQFVRFLISGEGVPL